MTNARNWQRVTKAAPCPACEKPDWCAWTRDGWLKCQRETAPPRGFRLVTLKDGGALFAPDGQTAPPIKKARTPVPVRDAKKSDMPSHNANTLQTGFRATLKPDQVTTLAAALGVNAEALAHIGAGWATGGELERVGAWGAEWDSGSRAEGGFTFPERDGTGRIVGFGVRLADGRKGSPAASGGFGRGLVVPEVLSQRSDPVLIVEGATDVAACETLQLAAVGRPSNTAGAEELAKLLDGRAVLVVGERDLKPGGAWPGRDGAKAIAARLAAEREEEVPWALPPDGVKDVRAWLCARRDAGLDLADAEACRAAGVELRAALLSVVKKARPAKKPGQAESLVRLALERYRLGRAADDQPFAVMRDGPNIAIMLRGSRDAMRASLARDYRRRFGSVPSATALTDALTTLAGEAQDCAAEPVHLRVAEHEGTVVLDLGTINGAAVVIGPDGWRVESTSPVLFRRTALSGALPVPEKGGVLDDLRDLINVTSSTWPLLLGWCVAAFMPDIPHPILLLSGEQGAGKSTAARFVVGIFDPSPAPFRSCPRDPEAWAMEASGSWVVVVDNVSTIPDWWSDALCKAVTGDGWVRRRLYSDSDLSVLSFRRVVALTSIDPGALRGDLGDRLLMVDLEPIPAARRCGERELNSRYAKRQPAALGALLDVVAGVLRELPNVNEPDLPRMADFARILAAMDRALGTNALALYARQGGRIATDVVDGDPVALAVAAFAEQVGDWSGSADDLRKTIAPDPVPHQWPRNARGLSGRLRRLQPALRAVGVEVTPPAKEDKTRRWTVRRNREGPQSTARTAQPPVNGSAVLSIKGDDRAVAAPGCSDRPPDRPSEKEPCDPAAVDSGRSGGSGGHMRHPFGDLAALRPCSWCRGSEWWRLPENAGWTCGRCHPPVRTDVIHAMGLINARSACTIRSMPIHSGHGDGDDDPSNGIGAVRPDPIRGEQGNGHP